jgi:hypothetical protein
MSVYIQVIKGANLSSKTLINFFSTFESMKVSEKCVADKVMYILSMCPPPTFGSLDIVVTPSTNGKNFLIKCKSGAGFKNEEFL